jgi:hypothetical protein
LDDKVQVNFCPTKKVLFSFDLLMADDVMLVDPNASAKNGAKNGATDLDPILS